MAVKANLKTYLVMAVFLLGFGCTIAAAEVIYVDADASTGGDGTTWPTAYKYLQDALAYANSNPDVNEIRVAEGTYYPDEDEAANVDINDRTETFQLISGVEIYGGFAGLGHDDSNLSAVDLCRCAGDRDLTGRLNRVFSKVTREPLRNLRWVIPVVELRREQ